MDAKIIVYAISLLALLGGLTGFYYTVDVDEAQKDFISAQQELGSLKETIKSTKKLTELRKETSALISAAHIIEAENEVIRAEAKKLSDSRDNQTKAFSSIIQKVRENTVGMTFPSISLSNGKVLKNAKIQSLDRDLTVIQHSEGVSKIPTETLSPELLDRLRFGFGPGDNGTASNESAVEYNFSGRDFTPSNNALQTQQISSSTSDSLVRSGYSAAQNSKPTKKVGASSSVTNKNDALTNGDPSLWQGVKRYSIGRAYVPGQGWLKIGSKGPIPNSGRN